VAKLQSALPAEQANAPGLDEGEAVELGFAVAAGRCVCVREVGRADGERVTAGVGAAVCLTLGAVVCMSVGDGGGSGTLVGARAYAETQTPKSAGARAPHTVAGLPEHRPWQQSAQAPSTASTGAKASLNTGTHSDALSRSKCEAAGYAWAQNAKDIALALTRHVVVVVASACAWSTSTSPSSPLREIDRTHCVGEYGCDANASARASTHPAKAKWVLAAAP